MTMKKTITNILGAAMLLIPTFAGAQALPFVAADMNAAALGKAGANAVETSSIAYSAFSNAAAIPFADAKADLAAGYTMWQPSAVGTNAISLAGAYNINGKFGVAAAFQYGMNPAYDIADAGGTLKGTYSPKDMQVNAAFAYRFLPFLSVGVNAGYASSSLAEGSSYGTFVADAYLMGCFSDFKVALGVANLGGGVTSAGGAKFSLPSSVNLGAGYGKVFAEKHGIDVQLDADYYFEGGVSAAVGAGYTFNDLVSVRAGYRYGGESPVPSFASVGLGVKFIGIRLDAAYLVASGNSPMKNTLAVGLGYSF